MIKHFQDICATYKGNDIVWLDTNCNGVVFVETDTHVATFTVDYDPTYHTAEYILDSIVKNNLRRSNHIEYK